MISFVGLIRFSSVFNGSCMEVFWQRLQTRRSLTDRTLRRRDHPHPLYCKPAHNKNRVRITQKQSDSKKKTIRVQKITLLHSNRSPGHRLDILAVSPPGASMGPVLFCSLSLFEHEKPIPQSPNFFWTHG